MNMEQENRIFLAIDEIAKDIKEIREKMGDICVVLENHVLRIQALEYCKKSNTDLFFKIFTAIIGSISVTTALILLIDKLGG